MKPSRILFGLAISTALSGMAGESGLRAQGFVLPLPDLPDAPMPELRSHRVEAVITNQVTQVRVDQLFYNGYHRALEGTYYFPLPEESSVSDFVMTVDGKEMKAELLDAAKARQIYEDIVRRHLDPALLEYAGLNLFRARLFPIPPKSERKIHIRYSQVLKGDAGLVKFVYPLRGHLSAERMGPEERPQPLPPIQPPYGAWPEPRFGSPPGVMPLPPLRSEGRTSDGRSSLAGQPGSGGPSGRTPPEQEKQGASNETITVEIHSILPIRTLYSPSHDVEVSQRDEHHARVSYEGRGSREARDFILYYALSEADFGLSLLTHRPRENEPGFFMVLLSPKREWSREEILDKDLVFVLDTSGSMAGEKMDQAKAALRYCMNHLGPRDRFALVAFSSEVKTFQKDLVPVSEYREAALEYMDGLEAKGGTNIHDALMEALKMTGNDQGRRLQAVVFLTDGQPTVGVTDVAGILNAVARANRERARIFAFGVGYDVNTHLLDQLAMATRSVSDYVEPQENIEEKVSSFYAKISHPVLADLEISYGQVQVEDVYPKNLPDLFEGSQLTLLGRYQTPGEADVELRGQVNGRAKVFTYPVYFQKWESENDFLPRLWATRKIGYLMDEIRLHGENPELKEEIVALSKKYGVASPYTSYLIQEETPMLSRGRVPRGARPLLFESAAPMAMKAPTGEGAVRFSKALKALRMAETEADGQDQSQEPSRYVAGRTFYLRDGVWIDSEFDEQVKTLAGQALDIQYGSDAYIQLLSRYPELGKILALGEKVIFKFKRRFIQIGDKGRKAVFTEEELRRLF